MRGRTKLILVILCLFLISLFVVIFSLLDNLETKSDNEKIPSSNESVEIDETYLLAGYPITEVPLFELNEISSCKFFVNSDPNNISTFGDKQFHYYNVVFYTDADQADFLDSYRNLFTEEIIEEYPIPDMVKGYIGDYRVTAAHYGSDDTAYVQVYLPTEDFTSENTYFENYPNLFATDSLYIEGENSYGLLNQVGGQVEYTKYFTVLDSGDQDDDGEDDVDEFALLVDKYSDLYKDKPEYTYDNESSMMSWEEDGYNVRASFTRDHGRVYLNIRGNIK